MLCDCKDWEPNRKQLDSAIMISKIHSCFVSVKVFVFCPYCKEIKIR